MKMSQVTRTVRLALMSLTLFAIAAFSVFGAGWATPARADGGTGTVPGGSGGGSNNNSSNTGGNADPNAAGVGTCGTGPQTFTVKAPQSVTSSLAVGVGSVKLLSNTGGVGNGAVRLLFAPIISFSADLLPAPALMPSPDGWTDLGCGIRTSGKVSDGRPVTYIIKGQQVCFTLPVGAAAAYSTLRIAYYDSFLARWVFLSTQVSATQACHSSFRLAPTTFALFGGA